MGKKLNFTDCMGFCIGQIVGSGVFVLTGVVMGLTGHGMPYAFLLAAVISLTQLIPMAILGSALPATGGSYVYAKKLIGPRAGFVYLMIFVLSQVLISTFALGFASYVAVIFPGVSEKLIAALAILAAAGVNLIGLKTSAKVQKGMVALLLVSLGIYIIFGLPKVNWEYLAPAMENLMPNGPMKFLRGAVMLSFACGGAWFALLTTLNGTLSWVTRGLQRASFDGWLPKSWGMESKNGAPVILLGFFVVVGLIPVITGMNTTDISNMGTGCSKLSDLLMVYACFRLPDVLPEVYEKSTLKMKPQNLKIVMVIVFIVLGLSSYVSLSGLTPMQFLGMGIYIAIAIAVMFLRKNHFQDADLAKK